MKQVFKSELLGEQYTLFTHASGLRIYVFPKKMTSTYALLATDFGAVDNAPLCDGKIPVPDGVAHFLEHKLFSNEDGSDAFEHFSACGADANAYTSHTRTVYLFSCTENFADALGELVDFVTHPYFTAETVQKEQGIIAEEIRMCRDNPYDCCYYNMLEGLYREHPVKTDICGSVSSIAAITPEILYEVYQTYYQLSNMALVVCGDVTPDAVFEIADKHLPRCAEHRIPPRRKTLEGHAANRARIEACGQVAKPIFSIGVKDTAIPEEPYERLKRDAGMAILSEMLFSESGELYNTLFDEGLISPEFSADYALTRDFAFLQLSGEANDPDLVFDRIKAYLEKKKAEGLSFEDFERCRRIEYAEYIKSFDSTEEIANTLLSFIFEGAELFSYADVLMSIDLAFVEQLLLEVFDDTHYTLSVIVPKKEEI
ncbi:MAG: insulinase family protein [Ruminococcaceae bacterium]|nr:insulinase family protein [Oscillospiraceae bacterium]